MHSTRTIGTSNRKSVWGSVNSQKLTGQTSGEKLTLFTFKADTDVLENGWMPADSLNVLPADFDASSGSPACTVDHDVSCRLAHVDEKSCCIAEWKSITVRVTVSFLSF